ncbi:high-potential iron-sulfur protein [Arenimonas composti]|uniref:High-potential iron-sulfur protein n=1 Tax=Arenimonas composti TR7-09 = DSM 18010 TaxID=1121013 RepID=A0A091B8K4_9GAMM|nr:high-potential iron-sulfur protein [Arenimonas composti]KFN48938.1 hypothetical protein P873_01160 [Arenimonas composti TR7-09 = DSM 18010]
MNPNPSRRRFLINAAIVAGAAPLAPLLVRSAAAQALTPLPADHPTAVALNYTADASKVTHASFKPGSRCDNCQFFTAGTNACTLFPGHSVAPAGWCTAWAKKA